MMKRTPLKRKTPLKRGGPIKRKPVSAEKKAESKAQYEKDWAFYNKIWANRSHVCEVHEGYKFLGYSIRNYFFDHLLEKSSNPELRYEEENIALVCYECHASKGSNPRPKHLELIRKAKDKFL